jgi:hypothetical protein
VAVLAADHPLAGRPELTVEDLLDEPFGWIDDLDPVARDFWTLGDRREGRPPHIGAHISPASTTCSPRCARDGS